MNFFAVLMAVGHVAAVLVITLVITGFGRFVANKARHPEVIGEITVGLVAGPVFLWLLGPDRFAVVLPHEFLDGLRLLSYAALALFLVGMVHKLRIGSSRASARAISRTVVGSLFPPFAAGLLLAAYVLYVEDHSVRGYAPAVSLVLMSALSLSITAVPVLARIVADRGLTDTVAGRLAFSPAIVVDAICWLLLPVVVGLTAGQSGEFVRTVGIVLGAASIALVIRALLGTRPASRWCAGRPRTLRVMIGVLAVGAGLTLEAAGVTVVLGAVLAGLAIPVGPGEQWTAAVDKVSAIGRSLVPIFFVVTGLTVFKQDLGSLPVLLIVLVVVLGAASKLLGRCLGARSGGHTVWDSMRVGALVNTRVLTELIVLQVGFSTGILTAPLF